MDSLIKAYTAPTQELAGVRYYSVYRLLAVAATLSDLGRDWYVAVPFDDEKEPIAIALPNAVANFLENPWELTKEQYSRLQAMESEYVGLLDSALEAHVARGFTYVEPRAGENKFIYNPALFEDIPFQSVIDFAHALFYTLSKQSLFSLSNGEFLAEKGTKLTGLTVRYYSSREIEGTDYYGNRTSYFFHNFIDTEGHLLTWRTGTCNSFKRDKTYTLLGGTVKAHDSYPGQPRKTMITRARFYDHEKEEKM